ncbi:hypothetical protein ACIU1J_05430 [Azospirillum doebereinerae]|uniref:hypothetical protein n=1 Tax=Azospirillum doebereinerae TaxID=92933 RepID=UPI001EE52C15|nr:hypothetical protein [Azospirillum doebereinerae]MCG5240857.1 hypothetical protein [Azospirillum doebereinerae]
MADSERTTTLPVSRRRLLTGAEAVTPTGLSSLTEDEVSFLCAIRSLPPDGRRAMRLAGQALLALGETRRLAEEAVALVPEWGPMIAKCLKEEADHFAAPAGQKEGAV